jgi:hypothetical protein
MLGLVGLQLAVADAGVAANHLIQGSEIKRAWDFAFTARQEQCRAAFVTSLRPTTPEIAYIILIIRNFSKSITDCKKAINL